MADKMWHRIRYASRWDPKVLLTLASRALDLKDVRALKISIDPLHPDNGSIREFWYQVTLPSVARTNPALTVGTEIRNDGGAPFFTADLADNRRVVFKTSGLMAMDVLRRFNRLLGNPEMRGREDETSEGRYQKSVEPY